MTFFSRLSGGDQELIKLAILVLLSSFLGFEISYNEAVSSMIYQPITVISIDAIDTSTASSNTVM